MGLDQLPLQRDRNDVLQMAGYGPVTLRIDYRSVLSTDADGVTFKGYIDGIDGRVVKEVGPLPFRHGFLVSEEPLRSVGGL